jgi:hypothetical protein
MVKLNFKDEKSLDGAKIKLSGIILYRKLKSGKIIGAKWPSKRKK